MSQPRISFNNHDVILKLDEYGYWAFKWSLEWANSTIAEQFNHDIIKNHWLASSKVLASPSKAQLILAYYNTAIYLYFVKSVLNLEEIFHPIIEVGLKVGVKSALEQIPNFQVQNDDILYALNSIQIFEEAIAYDLKKLNETQGAPVLNPYHDFAASRVIRLIELGYGLPKAEIPILIGEQQYMGIGQLLDGHPIDWMMTLKNQQNCILTI